MIRVYRMVTGPHPGIVVWLESGSRENLLARIFSVADMDQ